MPRTVGSVDGGLVTLMVGGVAERSSTQTSMICALVPGTLEDDTVGVVEAVALGGPADPGVVVGSACVLVAAEGVGGVLVVVEEEQPAIDSPQATRTMLARWMGRRRTF